ncbi:MAG: CPBP family intramembrane glutamic endopeptidase [Candidatus Hodarchaeota archaeon]
MKKSVEKYMILIFFLMALTLSWLIWIPMALGQLDIINFKIPIIVGQSIGGLAPLFSMILLDKISKGAISIKEIFDHIRLKGKKTMWLPISAVTLPFLTIIGNLINFLVGNEIYLFIFKNEPLETLGLWLIGIIPLLFFAGLLSSPLFEEPCWRGFALGVLQGRFGRQIGSLLVGSFWWIWHQPINIANGLEVTLYSYLLMVGHSFIIDSLYNLSNKNLLTAMFAHSSLIVTTTFIYSSNNPFVLLMFLLAIIILRILEWKGYSKQLTDKGENVMIPDQKIEKEK